MTILVKFRKSIMLAVKICIVVAMTCGFLHAWYTFYPETLFGFKGNYLVIFSYMLVFVVFSQLYGGFRIGIYRLHEVIYSMSLSAVFTNVIMYLELSLIARELISLPPFLIGLLYQLFVIVIGAYCANVIYFRLYRARKMLAVFADDNEGKTIIRKMSKIRERFDIERGVSINRATDEEIKQLIDKYEAVIICDFEKNRKDTLLRYCYANKKRTYMLPSSTDIILNNSDRIQIFDAPVLMCRNRGLTTEQEIMKRIFDIVLCVPMLIAASPLMLFCAAFIKLCDGGPVFYKQNRVTKDGKIFNVLKFRSMVVDADKDGAKKAETDDDRITRAGRFMRPFRIDELPQLFNILFGDMSFVGPRPERIENVYEYTRMFPDFDLRHRVKGGLTGYAQIYGKYNTSPQDKLKMDLIYIERYSILLDIKLIAMTVKILFMKESTEGFDASANADVHASSSRHEESGDKK